METGLKGKVVIVTGGSSNIGKGIVLAFAKEGSKLAIADIDQAQGEKVAEMAKKQGAESVIVVKTDVTKTSDVENLAKRVSESFGAIDVLVNNVGWPSDKPFLEQSKELIDKEMSLNFFSTFNCLRAVLPYMIQAKKGSIVNLGSEAGRLGDPERVLYSACKGGVITLTRAVARDVGKYGIRVNCVCPHGVMPTRKDDVGEGSMYHPSQKHFLGADGQLDKRYEGAAERSLADNAIQRLGTPNDIAPAVVFLASEAAGYITGQSLSVNGGHSMW